MGANWERIALQQEHMEWDPSGTCCVVAAWQGRRNGGTIFNISSYSKDRVGFSETTDIQGGCSVFYNLSAGKSEAGIPGSTTGTLPQ